MIGSLHSEFCAFEFPWCLNCPKSPAASKAALEDPMRSIVWHGWINGMPRIGK